MLKVLFVIWSLERGGAERFLVALLKNIDLKEIKPTVCCLNWKGDFAKEVEQRGIRVIALHKKPGLDLWMLIRLYLLMRRERFDIVNTHLWAADSLGRIAAVLAQVPHIVCTLQNVDLWKGQAHWFLDRLLVSRTRMFIAVSKAVADYYAQKIRIPKGKLTIIPNAIEIAPYEQECESAPTNRSPGKAKPCSGKT